MTRSTVSVIIPAYNAARTLERAVLSVLNCRAAARLDVVVIDDGSADDTLAVARRLVQQAPDSVRVMQHEDGANHGTSASRNVAARAARGEFIAFLDADDWYLPRRFDDALAMLGADPKIDGVFQSAQVCLEAGADEGEWTEGQSIGMPAEAGASPTALLCLGYAWPTSGITLRRAAFDACGGFDETVQIGEDLEMWIRLTCVAHIVPAHTAPVAAYSRHGSNRSRPRRHAEMLGVLGAALRWARSHGVAQERIDLIEDAARNYTYMAVTDLRAADPVQARRLLWSLARIQHGAVLTRRFWGNVRRSLGVPV